MIKENNKIHLYYILIACLVFFPLILGTGTIIWDGLSLWLPWKHFIVEELLNGFLPLWNPFHNGGFPQHADSMTWYPISWLFGFIFGEYNLYSINLEYLFHVSLSGYSFYRYTELYSSNKKIRFYLGLCYMFSGFILGNSQHISYLINAAWFPFVLLYLNKLKTDNSVKHIICFTLASYFFFSGGYLAIFFISIYILLFYISYHLINLETDQRKGYLKALIISFLLLFILSLPILYSTYNLFHLFERSDGINQSVQFNYGSTPWNGFYSVFLPFASGIFNHQEIEFSYFSAFLGTLPILMICYKIKSVLRKKELMFLLLVSVFFLLVSMGEIFKLRNLIYHLPLMNLFKFPTIFRFFFIFFILTLVSKLKAFEISENWFKLIKNKGLLIILLFLVFLLISLFFDYEISCYFKHLFVDFSVLKLPLLQRIKLNLFFIFCAVLFFVVFSTKNNYKKIIVGIAISEIILFASLAGPHIVYFNTNVHFANKYIKIQPKNYPQLVKNHRQNEREEWKNYTFFSWQAKTFYIKQWSRYWFNPLQIKRGNQSFPYFKQQEIDTCDLLTLWQNINGKWIKNNSVNLKLSIKNNQHFAIYTNKNKLKNAVIVLKQNNYNEWSIKRNNKEIKPLTSSSKIVALPYKENAAYIFSYQKQNYILIFCLSLALLLGLTLLFFMLDFTHYLKIIVAVIVLVTIAYNSIYERHYFKRYDTAGSSFISEKMMEDNLSLMDEKYWKSLNKMVFIPRNIPKTQQFYSNLLFYCPKFVAYTKIGNKEYEIREKKVCKRQIIFEKSYDSLGLMPTIDLEKEVRKNSFFYVKPIGINLSFVANDTTSNSLWLVHYKNKKYYRAITLSLKSNLGNKVEKNLIHYLDLSDFSFAYQDELRLFVWSDKAKDSLFIKKAELFYDL